MSVSCSDLEGPDLPRDVLLEMLSSEPELGLLEVVIRPDDWGGRAGRGGRVLVDREVPDIFSATTEFLELGLEVFTGRLERGGGGGMVERVRRCWWCWWGRTW